VPTDHQVELLHVALSQVALAVSSIRSALVTACKYDVDKWDAKDKAEYFAKLDDVYKAIDLYLKYSEELTATKEGKT
jgi:hypothetical protein